MRFSLKCTEHEDSTISDEEANNIEVDGMGSDEFELDVSGVHCSGWEALDEDDKEDEENNCTITVGVVVEAAS